MDGAKSTSLQARAALANRRPHDHLGGIMKSLAKFHADPLKTAAVHKEQRTDIFGFMRIKLEKCAVVSICIVSRRSHYEQCLDCSHVSIAS